MKVGDKYRFFIPAELAYGAEGAGPIPPYSALIFDVELLGIN
jgi:FKBP-type peptidyl-prolyl cis-trans isomerase